MMNLVEHRVTSGIDASVLTDRVKLASGRQRGEYLSPMKVDALRVLILLGIPAGNSEGDRVASSRILEHGYEPQYLAGPDRRFRVMRTQISVL